MVIIVGQIGVMIVGSSPPLLYHRCWTPTAQILLFIMGHCKVAVVGDKISTGERFRVARWLIANI